MCRSYVRVNVSALFMLRVSVWTLPLCHTDLCFAYVSATSVTALNLVALSPNKKRSRKAYAMKWQTFLSSIRTYSVLICNTIPCRIEHNTDPCERRIRCAFGESLRIMNFANVSKLYYALFASRCVPYWLTV